MAATQHTVTVPAAYLEDVRRAAVIEVDSHTSALRTMQIEVELGTTDREDLESNAVMLRRSMRLLDALLAADGQVKLTTQHDHVSAPLQHLLEDVVRVLNDRLTDAAGYGPTPMGEVLDLAERLRWAASEAIRIEPTVNARLSRNEKAAA